MDVGTRGRGRCRARGLARGRARAVGRLLLGLLVLGTVLTGTVVADAAGDGGDDVVGTDGNETVPDRVVASDRPDPETDVLGWENGVWANATLAIDQSDGIDAAELRALVARTMARLEVVRELEFDRTPPVRVVSRARQQAGADREPVGPATRTLVNTRYETLFLVNESRDAVDARQALFGGAVAGYYSPGTRNVTLVSPNTSVLQAQEGVLAQELFHALQDARFELPSVETVEERNTRNGYVEGDANFVQRRYEQRCEGAWAGSCYRPERTDTPDLSGVNEGMLRLFRQPYQSGYAFVRERYRAGGWDAVTELYERPPASTEQLIHPEAYRSDAPTTVRVTDRSTAAWAPLAVDGARLNGTVGEAGLYVALVTPAVETGDRTAVIPLSNHLVGGFGDPVRLAYDHPVTTGWDGDRVLPYVATDGNGTGYVHETVWDSAADAREFHRAYRRLLAYHGAEPVADSPGTYRIPEGTAFADAIHVERTGTRVRVVNAPTVAALAGVDRTVGTGTEGDPATRPPWQRVERTWQRALEGQGSTPATAADGRLYVAELGGTVRAVNATTGERAWTLGLNETTTAAPVAAGDTVYVVTAGGTLVAADATTGERRWTRSLGDPVTVQPRVADGTVYAATAAGTVHALAATSGEERWTRTVGRGVAGLTVGAERVYAAGRAGVSALDRAAGTPVWNASVGDAVVTAPRLVGDTLYVSGLVPASRGSELAGLAADTGTVRWNRTVEGLVTAPLAVTDGTVYAGTASADGPAGTLLAVDRDEGALRWTRSLDGPVRVAPVVADGTVYVGTAGPDGRLRAVGAADGSPRYTLNTTGGVVAPLGLADGTVYAGTDGGTLAAVNATTGERAWTFVADRLLGPTPVVTADRVYAKAGQTLYGLTAAEPPADGDGGGDGTTTTATTTTPGTDTADGTTAAGAGTTSGDAGPGFGPVPAVVAGLALLGLLGTRRRRT